MSSPQPSKKRASSKGEESPNKLQRDAGGKKVSTVAFRPEGYAVITPYLCIKGCKDALAFYKKAFNATETMKMPDPSGNIIYHAELEIYGGKIMLSDEQAKYLSPTTLNGTSMGLCVYVPDCDAAIAQAVAAGCSIEKATEDQFYGDRSGSIKDPFGHMWTLATHIEDVSHEEIFKRMAQMPAPKDGAGSNGGAPKGKAQRKK